MKVKSKEVASLLGISEATVSLALNGRPGVSEQTRKKVLKCIDDMRRSHAKSLENNTTNSKSSIKLIVYITGMAYYDDITCNIFSKMYLTMFQMANERELNLKLIYITDDDDIEKLILESVQDGTVGIYLAIPILKTDLFDKFRNCPIPIVVDDVIFPNNPFDIVLIDNEQAVKDCMDYLASMGHTDIMFFENGGELYNFDTRKQAFINICQNQGIENPEEKCFPTGMTIEEVYTGVMQYIQEKKKLPTAILAQNYAVSLGTIRAVMDSGYRIPDDISIIGIDELPPYTMLNLNFTYADLPHSEKTKYAMSCLFNRIEQFSESKVKLYVEPKLIIGNSVKDLKNSCQI